MIFFRLRNFPQDLHQHHEDWLGLDNLRADGSKLLHLPNKQVLVNSRCIKQLLNALYLVHAPSPLDASWVLLLSRGNEIRCRLHLLHPHA